MTRDEFTVFVQGEQEHLRRFLLALCCGNCLEADDLAQDALLKAYLAADKYTDQGKFRAWLYRIAYRTFLDSKRHPAQPMSLSNVPEMADNGQQADEVFRYQALYQALSKLPPHERYAILLFYIRGYAVAEIAKITETSEAAVKKQLQRGREHLRILLEDDTER